MKLWQLVSIMNNDLVLLQSLSREESAWSEIGQFFADFGLLVKSQDRAKLDASVPEALVKTALSRSEKTLFVGKDAWMRSWRLSPDDAPSAVVDAYERFGGDAVERSIESGAVAIG